MKYLYIILFVLFISHTFSDNVSGSFLTIPCGSRAPALGGAYIGLGNDIDSIFYNPSGIGFIPSSQLMVMHAQWFQAIKIENAGFAFPLKKLGSFGFGFRMLTCGGIERRDKPSDNPIEVTGAGYFDISTNFSHLFAKTISIGGNFHIIHQKIVDTSCLSFACDSGFTYSTKSRLFSLGVVIKNLGTKVKFVSEAYSLPLTIGSGVAFRFAGSKLIVATDIDYIKSGGITIHSGFEANIKNAISPRIGTNYNLKEKKMKFSMGMGFAVMGLGFDYTFAPFGDLGQTHRFTLSYSFGKAKGHIEKEIEKETYKGLEEQNKKMANSLYQTGVNNFNEGRYDEAVNIWDLALIYDPAMTEALEMIDKAREKKKTEEISGHLTRAHTRFDYGIIPDAIYECNEALKIDPSNTEAIEMLKSAEEELNRRVNQMKEDARKLYEDASSYYSRGDFKRALELLDQILNIDPNNKDAKELKNYAQLNLDEAILEFVKNAKRYEETGNWLYALKSWRQVLELDPSDSEAKDGESRSLNSITQQKNNLLAKGKELYNNGDYNGAETIFYQVLEISPDNSDAKSYISIISQKKKEKEEKEKIDYYSIYLAGINAYTDNKYITAIEYWKQIPEDNTLYSKAQSNIKRAQNILEKLK